MYLLYVDESGDTGAKAGSSPHFVLSGLVVHEYDWPAFAKAVYRFRRRMKQSFGFDMRREMHATVMISQHWSADELDKNTLFAIIRNFTKELAALPYVKTFSVVAHKSKTKSSDEVFSQSWERLLNIFENAIDKGHFSRGNANRCGMILCDDTDGKKLTQIFRRRQALTERRLDDTSNCILIEDPSLRSSEHSYFIQAADIIAYLTYQSYNPNRFFRDKGRRNTRNLLRPISLEATGANGIIEISI